MQTANSVAVFRLSNVSTMDLLPSIRVPSKSKNRRSLSDYSNSLAIQKNIIFFDSNGNSFDMIISVRIN